MAKSNTKSKKGFTIIEVVLVLAIAGLIFLMVFVAFPALQRNQRDTQRRQDYAQLSSAVISYGTNNNGKLPAANTELPANKYLNTTGRDPSGIAYYLKALSVANNTAITTTPAQKSITPAGASSASTMSEVYIYLKANCNGTNDSGSSSPKGDNNAKHFAIYGYLEGGSYCYAGSL